MLITIPLAVISYLVFVELTRYRRLQNIQAVYGSIPLTPWVAQQILHQSLFYEVPFTMYLGTVVALFKIYGIPTVSSLLRRTGELSTHDNITRRMADTGTLIATWVTNPLVGPGSGFEIFEDCGKLVDPRSAIAIARVNWLHRKYPILNDDYKYNLALFVLEPLRFTKLYAWRPHSELERQAAFVFWMEIGRRMGIQDLWNSLSEMEQWAETYEQECMTPSESSAELAKLAIDHFACRVPAILGLRHFMRNVIYFFLDGRTRRAMQLHDPPRLTAIVLRGILAVIRIFTRHFCLPRQKPSAWVSDWSPPLDDWTTLQANELPRMHAIYKRAYGPWYYPEPTGMRKCFQDLFVRIGVYDQDKIPGKRWKSEGYRLEELGPKRFEKLGHSAVMAEATVLQGTPVTGPWALDGGGLDTPRIRQ